MNGQNKTLYNYHLFTTELINMGHIRGVPARKKYPVSNPDILKFFEREDTKQYLKDIYDGVIPSERHDIVCSMFAKERWDAGIYTKIFRLASAQFLEDDGKIDKQLWNIVSKMFERVDLNRIRGFTYSTDFYEMAQVESDMYKYVFYVFVPEGIVKYIQDINNWDRDQAEFYYVNVESRVSQEELDDFDEEIALDQVREQERLQKEKEDAENEKLKADEISKNNDMQDFDLPDLDLDEPTAQELDATAPNELQVISQTDIFSDISAAKDGVQIVEPEVILDQNEAMDRKEDIKLFNGDDQIVTIDDTTDADPETNTPIQITKENLGEVGLKRLTKEDAKYEQLHKEKILELEKDAREHEESKGKLEKAKEVVQNAEVALQKAQESLVKAKESERMAQEDADNKGRTLSKDESELEAIKRDWEEIRTERAVRIERMAKESKRNINRLGDDKDKLMLLSQILGQYSPEMIAQASRMAQGKQPAERTTD